LRRKSFWAEAADRRDALFDPIGRQRSDLYASLADHQVREDHENSSYHDGCAAGPCAETVVGRKPTGSVAHGHSPEEPRRQVDDIHGERKTADSSFSWLPRAPLLTL